MTIELVSNVLFWCTIINYGLLFVWALVYRAAHKQVHRLWGQWFHLSKEQFDALSFAVMGVYKVGVLLFNLIPFIALQLAR